MDDTWNSLAIETFSATGEITCGDGRAIPGEIIFLRLYTGRMAFRCRIADDHFWLRLEKSKPLTFAGRLPTGQRIEANELITETTYHHMIEPGTSLEGFVYRPGQVTIFHTETITSAISSLICELTNMAVTQLEPITSITSQAQIHIQAMPKYKFVRHLMSATRTGGVLCYMTLEYRDGDPGISLTDLAHQLCQLLSLAQRTHVWCVAWHWHNNAGDLIRSHYEEPVFPASRPSSPLIPISAIGRFIEISAEPYEKHFVPWKLGEAQEYYLQGVLNGSGWTQALGLFTALETLKAAFLHSHKKAGLGVYVAEGKNKHPFKKKGVDQKIIDVLSNEFEEFRAIASEELIPLQSKILDLNRKAYKSVLRAMFHELNVTVEDDDLQSLVELRNQIIHLGSPTYASKKWRSSSEAFRWVPKFGALVEKTILAILGYGGDVELYDAAVQIVGE